MFQTDKSVNISQLGVELGRLPARWSGPDEDGVVSMVPLDGAELTEEQWAASVAAHVADPAWVDPEAPTPPPTVEAQIAALPNPAVDFDGFKAKLSELLT